MQTQTATQNFTNRFFSQSMNQIFNNAGWKFISDERESALHKYLRATQQI